MSWITTAFSLVLSLVGFFTKKVTDIRLANDVADKDVEIINSTNKQVEQTSSDILAQSQKDIKQIEQNTISSTDDSLDGLQSNNDILKRYVDRANSDVSRK